MAATSCAPTSSLPYSQIRLCAKTINCAQRSAKATLNYSVQFIVLPIKWHSSVKRFLSSNLFCFPRSGFVITSYPAIQAKRAQRQPNQSVIRTPIIKRWQLLPKRSSKWAKTNAKCNVTASKVFSCPFATLKRSRFADKYTDNHANLLDITTRF